jgi:hypothetical protein
MTDQPSQVLFIDDVCRELRISRRTLERALRHGSFPIAQLPSIDKHRRWSRQAVMRFLEGQPSLSIRRRA